MKIAGIAKGKIFTAHANELRGKKDMSDKMKGLYEGKRKIIIGARHTLQICRHINRHWADRIVSLK